MSFRSVVQGYFLSRDRGWMLSLLAAVCIVYLPFLGNPFIFDDLNFFTAKRLDAYAQDPFRFDLRWLSGASIDYTYSVLSNVHTHIYHLVNLLLHAGNVILLFYLLRRIIRAVAPDAANAAVRGAWIGALIFAVHPVAVYAVGYIAQRSILMATMFTLLMQLAYLRGLLDGQKRWLALAVLAYFLACFSKEHSVLAPGLLVALTLLCVRQVRVSWAVLWVTGGAFLAVAVLVTFLAHAGIYEPMATQLFAQQNIVASAPMLHLLSALNQAGLFFKYLWMWVFPNVAWMSIDMRVPFVATLADWGAWFAMIAFIAYGAGTFWLLLKGGVKGLIGFGLLYPWIQFWVEMVGVRVQEPFVLYRSYLWMPGLMLLFPLLVMKLPTRKTMFALVGVLLLLTGLSWNRLWVFSDNYRLWNEAVMLLPDDKAAGADRVHYNRAYYAAKNKQWDQAISDYELVTRIDPYIALVHHDLGVAYFNTRRFQDALVQFESAIILDPDYAKAHFNLGMTLKYLRRHEEAQQQMERSCKLGYSTACIIVALKPAPAKTKR